MLFRQYDQVLQDDFFKHSNELHSQQLDNVKCKMHEYKMLTNTFYNVIIIIM